jgi:hypothetical protein
MTRICLREEGKAESGLVDEDVDELSTTSEAKFHFAFGKCEQCVILTNAHVAPRVKEGSALADDDAASLYSGSVERLDSETLRVGVTTVPCRTATLGL